MCMIDDAEMATIYGEQDRTARKEHKCCECKRQIKFGERYNYASLLFDGEWHNYKTCQHCWQAKSWLQEECGGAVFESLQEDLEEHYQWSAPGPELRYVQKVLIGIRRNWQSRAKGVLLPLPGLYTRNEDGADD